MKYSDKILDLPKKDEELKKFIEIMLKKMPNAFLTVWCDKVSIEDRKRILEIRPNIILEVMPKGYDIFNPMKVKELSRLIGAMPKECITIDFVNSIFKETFSKMQNNVMYESMEKLCKNTIIGIIAELGFEKLNIDVIKFIVENAEDKELVKLNFPRDNETFELIKENFGTEFALTFVNPNMAETAQIEEILFRLKDSSLERFEKMLFAVAEEKQTEKMYALYLEIAQNRGEEELKRCLSNISPRILNSQFVEQLYKIYPAIWEMIPKEKQNEEILYTAIKNENDVIVFLKNVKIKNADIIKLAIERIKADKYKTKKTASKYEFDYDDEEEEVEDEFQPICSLLKCVDSNNIEAIKVIVDALGLNSENIINKYIELAKHNKDINSTLNLKFLDSKFDFFSLEELLRITAYPYIQENIINSSENEIYLKVLKRATEISEDSIAVTEKINSNIKFYNGLFNDPELASAIATDKSGEIIERLIKMCINNEINYFGIDSLEKLNNYENIRYDTCVKILNDEKVRINSNYELTDGEIKKFAVFELLYGLDYDNALNLYEKYGKDIDNIPSDESLNNENIKEFIRSIGAIINLDDEMLKLLLKNNEFMELIKNSKARDLGIATDIERRCLDMYVELYQKAIFSVDSELAQGLAHGNIEFNGNNIETIELSPEIDENGKVTKFVDFMMIGRVEGAYTDWVSPENYAQYFEDSSLTYHGNCESLISQNLLALARPKIGAPTVGYSDARGMLLQAPWDIKSRSNNDKLSIVNCSHATGNGVQFNSPESLIENTRHTHNEIVSDRIVYDRENQKIDKRKPSFVISFRSRKDEIIDEETKKAATDLNVPIVIIDREAFAIQEQERFNNYLEIFEGKRENNTGLNNEELMRKIITSFETNHVGTKFVEGINEKYFTDENRDEMLDRIMNVILNMENRDEQVKNAVYLMNITEQEKERVFSTSGKLMNDELVIPYKRVRKFVEQMGIDYVCKLDMKRRKLLVECGMEDIEDVRADAKKYMEKGGGKGTYKSITDENTRDRKMNKIVEQITNGVNAKKEIEEEER